MEYLGLSAKIADFITSRCDGKLEAFDKKTAKDPTKTPEDKQKERSNLERQFNPSEWLSDAARRVSQIHMVTHALKYTHCDARGMSCFALRNSGLPTSMNKNQILSTASINKPDIDVVGNAAALDVAKFLLLEHDGQILLDCIQQDDLSPLLPFATDYNQAEEWMKSFKNVLTDREPDSHKLAKQVYFPIGEGFYHLLSPLFSSSLANAVHSRIVHYRYSEESKELRTLKKEAKYSESPVVEFPSVAQQNFGGTKPQNISYLNSARGGKAFLFNCAPPTWKAQTAPPLRARTVFSRGQLGLRMGKDIWALQQYLLRHINKGSTVAVRDQRGERIDALIDQLIQYGAEIQNLTTYTGWSAASECKLPQAEKLWLDPYRGKKDADFAQERESGKWKMCIAESFARWLNQSIKHNLLTPGDAEQREWQSLVKKKARLLEEYLEDL